MKIFKKFSAGALALSLVLGSTLPILALADDNLTPVNLGASGNFAILARTGISTTGSTSIVGDIGISPASAAYITGFNLNLSYASAFSTSSLVNGKVYAPEYASSTASNLAAAVGDMQNAYADTAGRDPDVNELAGGNIGGLTITPGVYRWSTSATISTDVTLSGSADDIWIFQVGQNLNVSSDAKVILSGGAQASNIFWVVGRQTTLGTNSTFNGNILDQTAIVLNTGAKLNGRALAQTAVTLDSNSVTIPGTAAMTLTPTPVSVYTNNSSVSPSSTNSATTNVAGCTSTTGFSALNGQLCASSTTTSNANTTAVSTGCSGNAAFSSTTGKPCSGSYAGVTTAASSNASGRVTYNFGALTLRNGSRGEAVMELQRFLNAKLNLGLVVDGKLGPRTIAVIKKWQMDHGLVADGLIGVKTKAMMNAE